MKKEIATFVLEKLMGWKVEGFQPPPELNRFVYVGAPHTSNWDFVLGVLARSILGLDIKFLGKDALFKPPYGWLFRWLGGYPVDRSKRTNLVDNVVQIFEKEAVFSVVLAPSGSRSKGEKWKTGFYHIARLAKVPILFVGFDYKEKRILLREPFYPTGNYEEDMRTIIPFFNQITAKFPENTTPILKDSLSHTNR